MGDNLIDIAVRRVDSDDPEHVVDTDSGPDGHTLSHYFNNDLSTEVTVGAELSVPDAVSEAADIDDPTRVRKSVGGSVADSYLEGDCSAPRVVRTWQRGTGREYNVRDRGNEHWGT